MRNLNAFNDCMHDVLDREYGFPAEATGLVMVLTQFDEFAREFPDTAHALLDIFAAQSRSAMLAGEQLIALVQSNDPRFALPPVGATPVIWNDAEWLNSHRGL
ncbi:barstar family protein [Nocardia niigatensis]